MTVAPKITTIWVITACIFILGSAPRANASESIEDLIHAQRYDEALAETDALLQKNPQNASVRLAQGLILSKKGRTDEAISVYAALLDDFPDMAEAYNNLAVLLTSTGQYGKALDALENAVRINPKYAVAQENLGDLYAKLAIRAYAKAVSDNNSSAMVKINRMHSVFANLAGTATDTNLPTASVMVKPANSATGASDNQTEREQVLQLVKDWASAWSARNINDYLGFYGDAFQTPDHLSRSDWEALRSKRISGKEHIEVTITAPAVSFSNGEARVTFHQIYSTGNTRQENRKILHLAKQGDSWKIIQELIDKDK